MDISRHTPARFFGTGNDLAGEARTVLRQWFHRGHAEELENFRKNLRQHDPDYVEGQED